MKLLQQMDEPVSDAPAVDTVHPIAENEILATTSHQVFHSHTVVPAAVTAEIPVVPHPEIFESSAAQPRQTEILVVAQPEVPETFSVFRPKFPLVARSALPALQPIVTFESEQPETTVDEDSEIAPLSDESSEVELDLNNVGRIPENVARQTQVSHLNFYLTRQSNGILGTIGGALMGLRQWGWNMTIGAAHRAIETAGAERLELYKQATEEYVNGMRDRRTRLGSGGPETSVEDVTPEESVEAAAIPATELPSDNNVPYDVQSTENVRMPVPLVFPEDNEQDSGHGDAIHNNENKARESLHKAVAAASKQVQVAENTFTSSLDSPRKLAKIHSSLPLKHGGMGLAYINPAVEEVIAKPPKVLPLPMFHEGSSMDLDPSVYPGGAVDTGDPIPWTSNKAIPLIPIVGPVDPTGETPVLPLVPSGKETSDRFVATAPKGGMVKFEKPAGLAVAIGAGLAGLFGTIWAGNKFIGNHRNEGGARKKKAGKQRQRRHTREWVLS